MGAPEQSGGQGRKPKWPARTRKGTQPPWAAVGQPYGGLHKGVAGMAHTSSWARTFPRVKMPMASTQCGHESVSQTQDRSHRSGPTGSPAAGPEPMGAAQQDPLTKDDTCEGKLLLFGALGSGGREPRPVEAG